MFSIETIPVNSVEHPYYTEEFLDFFKYRLTFMGGRRFVNEYTNKFSTKEDEEEFKIRVANTYCPAFAKSEIKSVISKIVRALIKVKRIGGTKSYKTACEGGDSGVDLAGMTMSDYIGLKVLPEMAVMRKVGVYVDMPKIAEGVTQAETYRHKPYLYLYTTEDIRSWTSDQSPNPNEFSSVLLREARHKFDKTSRLPIGEVTVYKHFYLEDGRVYVQHYSEGSTPLDEFGEPQLEPVPLRLSITRIPFVVFELPSSLLTDVAQYQIALMNMASADLNYAIKSNYPFYVEQFDFKAEMMFMKNEAGDLGVKTTPPETNAGAGSGRRYPIGSNQPAFIAPPSETLEVSMKKQEQMKKEIKELMNNAVSDLGGRPTGDDLEDYNTGLAFIGAILQKGENQIGEIWSMYENSRDIPKINYPIKYRIKTDDDRRKDVETIEKNISNIPAKTFQKELSKKLARTLLDQDVSQDTMDKIEKEIDEAVMPYIPPDVAVKDVEQGLVGIDTASKLRGYPSNEVDKAKQDHADKLARIAQTQGLNPTSKDPSASLNSDPNPSARGVHQQDGETDAGSTEKKGKNKRGQGK